MMEAKVVAAGYRRCAEFWREEGDEERADQFDRLADFYEGKQEREGTLIERVRKRMRGKEET